MINAEVLVESKVWEKIVKNPKKLILNIFKSFPKSFRFINKTVSISILLSNNSKIKKLNKKFRNKNMPTDILSFPFFDKKNFKKNIKNKNIYLGDIIISHEEFKKKNKNDIKNDFIKILIHGFLHLLNYDHKSKNDYKIMNSIENKIFNKVKG